MNPIQVDTTIRNLLGYAEGWRGEQVGNPDPKPLRELNKDIALGKKLLAAIPDLIDAAEQFVAKVERGEARSKRSYKQFKDALSKLS